MSTAVFKDGPDKTLTARCHSGCGRPPAPGLFMRTGRPYGYCCADNYRVPGMHSAECNGRDVVPSLPTRDGVDEWVPTKYGEDGLAATRAQGEFVGKFVIINGRRTAAEYFFRLVKEFKAGTLGCGLKARLRKRGSGEAQAILSVYISDLRVEHDVRRVAAKLASLGIGEDGHAIPFKPEPFDEEGTASSPTIWSFRAGGGVVETFARVEPGLDTHRPHAAWFWAEFGGPVSPMAKNGMITTAAQAPLAVLDSAALGTSRASAESLEVSSLP